MYSYFEIKTQYLVETNFSGAPLHIFFFLLMGCTNDQLLTAHCLFVLLTASSPSPVLCLNPYPMKNQMCTRVP